MKIVCAGTRRSGSTWLYNAVRLSLAQRGEVYARFEDDWKINRRPQQVVKAHKFLPAYLFGADKVLCSIRDPRDIAASAVRRELCADRPVEVVRFLTRALVDEHEQWAPHADYTLRYESMIRDPAKAVREIAGVLEIKVDANAVAASVDALPNGDRTDPEVLIHPDHITDGRAGSYRETLSPASIKAIEAVFGDWMEVNGY